MSKSPDAFRTISEVAEVLDTPAHVLRFWESRFSQVKPVKRAGGRRYYRPSDMALLAGIRKLLHDDGMTIKGVQKVLREKGVKHVSALGRDSNPLFDDDGTGMADAAEPQSAPDSAPQASVLPFRAGPVPPQDAAPAQPEQPPDEVTAPQDFDWSEASVEDQGALSPADDSLASYARPFAETMDDQGGDPAHPLSEDIPSQVPGNMDSLADYARPFAEAVLQETDTSNSDEQAQFDLPAPDTLETDAHGAEALQETAAPSKDASALPALPDDPELSQLAPGPGRLPPVAGLTRLSTEQARALAPLVTRLRHMLDSYPGNPG